MRAIQSTAAALVALAGAIVFHGFLTLNSTQTALAAPARGGDPVVVGFAVSSVSRNDIGAITGGHYLWRLWSDGTVERRFAGATGVTISGSSACSYEYSPCAAGEVWKTIPGTPEGFACAPDVNGDRVVDGADLGLVLGAWGVAVCDPVPPIECTLGQIGR